MSTLARCWRYSTLALRSACGIGVGRRLLGGVGDARPTGDRGGHAGGEHRGGTHVDEADTGLGRRSRHAATPTMAQSWARRLNFWKLQPAPFIFGTRISVSISSGSSADSKNVR